MTQQDEKGKLFVGGLSWETTQATLLAYFCKFGEVKDCVVITNPQTGKSRGFGFVTFKDPVCVDTVQAAGPHILDGKQIDPNGCNRKKTGKTSKGLENSKKKLFVGGLPSNIDETQLREGFSSYGKINEVVIVYDQQKQKPRGFGFLTFENEESVDKIVKERFVLLNGKQVECKRAEAKEPPSNQEQATGLMMIAQAADGTIGLVPAASGVMYPPAGSFVTPAELAGAYKGLLPGEGMHSAISGMKFLQQPGTGPQYVLLGGGSNSGSASYLVQGAPSGHGTGGILMQGTGLTPTNQIGGLVVGGAQTPGMLVGSGGGAGGTGILLQGNHGSGLQTGQYLMQYPTGATVVQTPHAVEIGASLGGFGSTISGVQLPQTIYSLAKTEAQGDSEKTAVVAAPYSVINPYATLGLVGGTSNDSLNEDPGTRGSSSNESITSSSTIQAAPKLGYYIVPSYNAASQLSAQYGSPIVASPDPNQPAIIATPSLNPYSRLAQSHATLTHSYHPYRR